ARSRSSQRFQKLRQIVEQSPKAGCVAASVLIQAGAAPVYKRYAESCSAQTFTRVLIPTSVTLNSVNANDVCPRWAVRQVTPVTPGVTVAGNVLQNLVHHGSLQQGDLPHRHARQSCGVDLNAEAGAGQCGRPTAPAERDVLSGQRF